MRRRHRARLQRGVQRRCVACDPGPPRAGAAPGRRCGRSTISTGFSRTCGAIPMAKAAVIDAFVDAELRGRDVSLASWLGAERDRVACGVSIGIADAVEALLDQVGGYLADGYQRIKLKIEPGIDVERVAAVRGAHPDIALSVDANAAYTHRRRRGVPFARRARPADDRATAAPLRPGASRGAAARDQYRHLPRRVDPLGCRRSCAIELESCRIVNIKQGRVGGIVEARRMHDVCLAAGVPVWCGGMLETGIGRAQNLALAAMPGFTLPGDTSASARYFHDDLTEPFVMASDGTMAVPDRRRHRRRTSARPPR